MSDVICVLGKTAEEMEKQETYFRILKFLAEINELCKERSGFSLSDTELESRAFSTSNMRRDSKFNEIQLTVKKRDEHKNQS